MDPRDRGRTEREPTTRPVAHTPKVVLVTGGAGFIGCNYVRYLLKTRADARVVVYDALTYAGNLSNLDGLAEAYPDRYLFVHANVCDEATLDTVFREEGVDTVVHFAAESHVDRSIDAPATFIQTNVVGTYTLLQAARRAWGTREDVRFHHISTDEVFGSLGPEGAFSETTPYDPSSPYSASKASADHLVWAWQRTYGLKVSLTNCSNNYGPYQFPEKLLPLMIMNALAGEPLPVYGDGQNVRDWIYVEDHCRAVDLVVRRGQPGSAYNIGGRCERANLDLVRQLCDLIDRLAPGERGSTRRDLITFVPDRPGHDRRYAMDSSKIERELGFRPVETMESGLRKTVTWYLEHQGWVDEIKSGRYRGERLGLLD